MFKNFILIPFSIPLILLLGCSNNNETDNPLDVMQQIRKREQLKPKRIKVEEPFYIFNDSIVWQKKAISFKEFDSKLKEIKAQKGPIEIEVIFTKNIAISNSVFILEMGQRLDIDLTITSVE